MIFIWWASLPVKCRNAWHLLVIPGTCCRLSVSEAWCDLCPVPAVPLLILIPLQILPGQRYQPDMWVPFRWKKVAQIILFFYRILREKLIKYSEHQWNTKYTIVLPNVSICFQNNLRLKVKRQQNDFFNVSDGQICQVRWWW